MESKPFYIIKNGVLRKKGDTLYFITRTKSNEKVKRALPVNGISDIYIFGRVWISPGAIELGSKLGIPVHIFSYYGFYRSTIMPKKTLLSGSTVISQAKAYLDNRRRLDIAKEFINGASENMIKTLTTQFSNKDNEGINRIKALINRVQYTNSISELMAIEGNIRNEYYKSLDKILPSEFNIIKRVKRPPNNPMNTLISFGNSLLYAAILTQIYNTHLDPTISFLHEPFERRYSLSLDISEVFKPIIVDRVILKLINKKMIDLSYFDQNINYSRLNEKGKRLFIEEFDAKLSDTINHKNLNKRVSYKHLIRLECYKLEKDIIGLDKYKSFKMWW